MMKTSRDLNTSTQTAGSLLPEMPKIHHLAMRAQRPDADFRNTAGKYHCVQIPGGERCFLFHIWSVCNIPYPPPSYTSLIITSSELFSRKLNRYRPLSPTTQESCNTVGPKGFSASNGALLTYCIMQGDRKPPTQLISSQIDCRRAVLCVTICLLTRKFDQQGTLPHDLGLSNTITQLFTLSIYLSIYFS